MKNIPCKSNKAMFDSSTPSTLYLKITGKIQGITHKILVLVIKQCTIWLQSKNLLQYIEEITGGLIFSLRI